MLYIALESSSYAKEIAEYLNEKEVSVTAEYVTIGDPDKISFDTLAKLPPCHIRVTSTIAKLELALWRLKQVAVKLLRLEIDGIRRTDFKYDCPDLRFLGTTLTKLCLRYLSVNPETIPTTVTRLRFRMCEINNFLDFTNFINLTHFETTHCGVGMKLPQLIISLWIDEGVFDASTLPNLKRVLGYGIVNPPWSQLESVMLIEIPLGQRMEQLKELEINDLQIGTNVEYSILERVEIMLSRRHSIYDYIPPTQLVQVRDLDVGSMRVPNVENYQNLTKLLCGLDETLTEDYPLPPNLVDLSIRSTKGVKGVPSQLKSFAYTDWPERESNSNAYSVVVKSDRLKKLVIVGATSVTIDCPNLTDLDLFRPHDLSVHLPNLVTLFYVLSDDHPIPFPFEQGYTKLQNLTLFGLSQDVVFEQPMKSISLMDVKLNRFKVLADSIRTENCEIPFETDITARVFESLSPSISSCGIKCRELHCKKIDQVPSSVEKLSLVLEEPNRKNNSVVPELRGCAALTSLTIRGGLEHYRHGITISPSVKQLAINDGKYFVNGERTSWGELRIISPTRLEHFELIGDGSVTFSQTPASVFVEEDTRIFDPTLL